MLNQTCKDFVWLVVDGGSTDSTLAILADSGVKQLNLVSEEDFGIYHALNKGIRLIDTEYYVILGSDDILFNFAVEEILHSIEKSSADIFSFNILMNGKVVSPSKRPIWISGHKALVSEHAISSVFKTSLHDELGLYTNRYPIAADHDFILRCNRKGKTFLHFNCVIGEMGNSGISARDKLGAILQSFRIQVTYFSPIPQIVLLFYRILGVLSSRSGEN